MWFFVLKVLPVCLLIQMTNIVGGSENQTSRHLVIQGTRLSGGPREFEGIVEVKTEGGWHNLCADSPEIKTITKHTCQRFKSTGKTTLYKSNIYDAPRLPSVIKSIKCNLSISPDRINCPAVVAECSQVMSLCCSNNRNPNVARVCSADWSTSLGRKLYHLFVKPDFNEIRNIALKDLNHLYKNLSWTKYAFEVTERMCDDKQFSTTVEQHRASDCIITCANDWLERQLANSSANVDVKEQFQKCRCFEQGNSTTGNETCLNSTTVLHLVSKQSKRIVLCVAVSITKGQLRLVVQDCTRYLPSFEIEPLNVDVDLTTTADVKADSDDGSKSEIIGSVIPTLLVSVVACSLFILYKFINFKRRGGRRGLSVSNSVNNEGYFRGGRGKGDNHEEYALINEMEMSTSTVHQNNRPPLPQRDGAQKAEKEINVVDDYTLPKDAVSSDELDPQSTVYTSTYDDPVRLKLRRSNCDRADNESGKVTESNSENSNKDLENENSSGNNSETTKAVNSSNQAGSSDIFDELAENNSDRDHAINSDNEQAGKHMTV